MKLEIRPTGEPLTQAEMEKAMALLVRIRSVPGVTVVMKPTAVSVNADGTLRLSPVPRR